MVLKRCFQIVPSWELKNFQLADLGAVASSFSFLIPLLSVPKNTTSNSVLH